MNHRGVTERSFSTGILREIYAGISGANSRKASKKFIKDFLKRLMSNLINKENFETIQGRKKSLNDIVKEFMQQFQKQSIEDF